jgi:hypothetical protein
MYMVHRKWRDAQYSQVSYYMTQRKKGGNQHISAMKAGISVAPVAGSKKISGQKPVIVTGGHAKIRLSCLGQRASPAQKDLL